MNKQLSLVEEIEGNQIYSIWGSTDKDIQKFKMPRGIDRDVKTKIDVKPKYEPHASDNIKIYTIINRGNIVKRSINHATLLIHSANNDKLYSMGFSSSQQNKLCILSPDPTLIEAMRNKHPDNPLNLIYEQNKISKDSISKLKNYVKNSIGHFPVRRKIPEVCYNIDYKGFFSRQRVGFNCWTALEDIFPDFTLHINKTIPSISAYLARGKKKYKKNKNLTKKRKKKRAKKLTKKRYINKAKVIGDKKQSSSRAPSMVAEAKDDSPSEAKDDSPSELDEMNLPEDLDNLDITFDMPKKKEESHAKKSSSKKKTGNIGSRVTKRIEYQRRKMK